MKNIWLWGTLGVVLMAGLIGFLGAGCETVSSQGAVIVIDPPLTTVTGVWAIAFTISSESNSASLFLPLDWSVSDRSLGRITSQGGYTALYEGFAMPGINTITVRDQREAEGIALVNQVPALGIALSPDSAFLRGAGALQTFTVSNAAPASLAYPLIWTSSNPELGDFIDFNDLSAIYQSKGGDGFIIIRVTDQIGASATAVIRQI